MEGSHLILPVIHTQFIPSVYLFEYNKIRIQYRRIECQASGRPKRSCPIDERVFIILNE